jgi:tetratricopeptide (TPR) repeat protein
LQCGAILEAARRRRSLASPAAKKRLLRILAFAALGEAVAAVAYLRYWRGAWGISDAAGFVLAAACGVLGGVLVAFVPARVLRLAWRGSLTGLYHILNRIGQKRGEAALRRARRSTEAGELDAYHRLGVTQLLLGHLEMSKDSMSRAAELAPSDWVVRHNLGVVLALRDEWGAALGHLEAGVKGLDKSPRALCNWARALASRGLYERAREAWDRAIEMEPRSAELRTDRAVCLAAERRYEEALQELERAAAEGRRMVRAHNNLGVVSRLMGDSAGARAQFRLALRYRPAYAVAHYNLGVHNCLEGRYEEARERLLDALRLRPDHARSYSQLGIAAFRIGLPEQALTYMRQGLELAPNDSEVRYNYGTLLILAGQLDIATRELELAFALNPTDPDIVNNLGVSLYLRGRVQESVNHFRLAVRLGPENAVCRHNLGTASDALGMTGEAMEELREAVRLAPAFGEAHNNLAVTALVQKLLGQAVEGSTRASELLSHSALPYVNLGLAYYLQGDQEGLIRGMRLAVKRDPSLPAVRDLLGRAYFEKADLLNAVEQWEELVELEPSNPEALTNLGVAYYRHNQMDEAIARFRRVLLFLPHSVSAQNNLGLAYAKNGLFFHRAKRHEIAMQQLDLAITHLGRVLDMRPRIPITHSNYGLALYLKGETEKAVGEWMEVTRLSPAYARAREATRLSAFDDSEMLVSPLDVNTRVARLPPRSSDFHQRFELDFDEKAFVPEIPWWDLVRLERWLHLVARLEESARAGSARKT